MVQSNLIDNVKHIETPLGVELDLHPAGLPVRAAAFAIDTTIKFTILAMAGLLLSQLAAFGFGLFLILYFVLDWFYFVIFDLLLQGQPPGKKAMGIRTIHANGTPITLGGSAIRTLLLAVDFLPLMYIAGVVTMSTTSKFNRIGDLAAGTMVVHDRPYQRYDAKRIRQVKKVMVPLMPDERLNILAFQDRVNLFSDERQQELCETLLPLTQVPKRKSVDGVLQIAEGIRRSA